MKRRAYLDIETTGLSAQASDITVVGICFEHGKKVECIQLFEETLTRMNLKKIMKDSNALYTYNGARFDLPFIETRLGLKLDKECPHVDLMHHCWRNNLYGGLKAVERQLKITRNIEDVDGYMAVILWKRYKKYGDKKALSRLLEYNKEDVLNLIHLRNKLSVL